MGGGGEYEIYYRHFFEVKRLKDRVNFTPDQVVLNSAVATVVGPMNLPLL